MRAHEPHLHSTFGGVSYFPYSAFSDISHLRASFSYIAYLSQAKRTIKMSFCGWGGEKYKDHFEDGEL